MECIHLVVTRTHLLRFGRASMYQRIHRVAEHFQSDPAHFLDFRRHRRGTRGILQSFRRFRDVHAVIPYALQVGVDLEDREQQAQVARHRLVQGQQLDALFLDPDFLGIDQGVGLEE